MQITLLLRIQVHALIYVAEAKLHALKQGQYNELFVILFVILSLT